MQITQYKNKQRDRARNSAKPDALESIHLNAIKVSAYIQMRVEPDGIVWLAKKYS